MATAAFICGGIALLFGWFCGIPIAGLLAVIFGFVALNQIKNRPDSTSRGFAITGIVLGGINLAFFALWILWFILAMVFGN
jgi:hypothetical protein